NPILNRVRFPAFPHASRLIFRLPALTANFVSKDRLLVELARATFDRSGPCPEGQRMTRPVAIRYNSWRTMMVLLDFTITPLSKGESVSSYVAHCLEVVAASGLDYRLHALGTILEGELEQALDAVRRCFEALQPNCDRVSCSI